MTGAQSERFDQLVRSFETAMLVTQTANGDLRARPMSLAAADADGDLWFTTGVNSGRVSELSTERRVAVVMQGSDRFVSITGTADVVVDREKAERLWSEAWRPWFPKGPDDPELVLVHVHSRAAEFWDLRGLCGFVYLFDAVRHAIQGDRMGDGPSAYHDEVALPAARTPKRDPMPRSPTLTGWFLSQLRLAAKRARSG